MRIHVFLVILALSTADNWWDRKPFTEWTMQEVSSILADSPWVAVSVADVRLSQSHEPLPYRSLPWCYRVRVLSSRAVCNAYLRLLSLGAMPEANRAISLDALRDEVGPDAEQARLQRFLTNNPDDIRVKGGDQWIVISLTRAKYLPQRPPEDRGRSLPTVTTEELRGLGWLEDARPEELLQVHFEDLAPATLISTEPGRVAHLMRYEAPGTDLLGAKLFFARSFYDGTPFVTPGNKELRFETRVGDNKIKVKFDLRKMIYDGKLEI